ncbi:hypothetical protein LXL04_026509 [Taraxacum kok-saghyz]
MCTHNSKCVSSPPCPSPIRYIKSNHVRKDIKLRVRRLDSIDVNIKREMEVKNLKLYMENINILKENEKLRMKATKLRQENLLLLSKFSGKIPKSDSH